MRGEDEFFELIDRDRVVHNKKTVDFLNRFFNTDISDTNAIILFVNKSNCNMVLRIKGDNDYDFAIPANGQNSLVVKQGRYELSGRLCKLSYSSIKFVDGDLSVTFDVGALN